MKKSLVALAALAATGAFAQSSVTLSGRASMDVSTFEATGSTAGASADFKRRTRIADTASRITFAATEDLGGGLRAGVYCETGINIDTASNYGQANTNNGNTSEFCSREGRMFIGNNTGEVRLGRQNVWWTQGALNGGGSTYLGSDTLTNLINGGVGVYTVRGENQIMLNANSGMGALAGSQVYYGVMGIAGGNAAAPATQYGEATGAGLDPKSKYYGFKLQYTAGQIVGMIDYQKSQWSGAAAAGGAMFDRDSTKYGLGYRYKGANNASIASVQIWNKERKDQINPTAQMTGTNSATGSAKDSGYGFVVHHDFGGGLMGHAQWGKAKNLKGTPAGEVAGTGATGITLGGTYALSRRTHLYASYHKITNQANANYNMAGGNYTSAATIGNGADVKMFALGAIHNF